MQECAGLDGMDEERVLVGVPAIADKVSIPGGDDNVPELLGRCAVLLTGELENTRCGGGEAGWEC